MALLLQKAIILVCHHLVMPSHHWVVSDADGDVCCPQLYADGNFKITRLKAAGSATHRAPPIQHRIQDDSLVSEFCTSRDVSRGKGASDPKECNDFNADKFLPREPEKYDITGWKQCYFLCLPRCQGCH